MELEKPIIDNSKGRFNFITSIWIVPFVAAIIALWLMYQHFSKLGPEIKITFKNSGGLVAEQSVIKFRDVPVGKISRIEINNDSDGVIVHARINKDAKNFLNETTKFWVVKPEVDYSGVKGLDTLLSGSYIAMYAKKGKNSISEFQGSSVPYVDINSGNYYVIESSFPVKFQKHTPAYYKGVKVGEIDNILLDTQTNKIVIVLRIFKEYGSIVNSSSKFWVQNLMDLRLTDNRLEVNLAPLPSLLLGAIAFDTQFDKHYDKGFSKIYNLFESQALAKQKRVGYAKHDYKRFIFDFKGDVSSLDRDTIIKYKGFRIGELDNLKIHYNDKLKNFEAKCSGRIDVSNFSDKSNNGFKNFKKLFENGLIAKLKKPNFLINKSEIVLEESNTSNSLKYNKKLHAYELPTLEYSDTNLILTLQEIANKINNLNLNKSVKNINSLLAKSQAPIEKLNTLLSNANTTISSINKMVSKKDFQNISKGINKSLNGFNKSLHLLNSLLNSYGKNSLFKEKLEGTLKEVHDVTESLNELLYKLNKKPNSLIFGE